MLMELELTDKGESAPILWSRKNDAESMDVIANMRGFVDLESVIFIDGREDQTLPSYTRNR